MHQKSPSIPSHPAPKSSPADGCPYVPPDGDAAHKSSSTRRTLEILNPLNYMPQSISQARAPGQTTDLPLSREPSTIPKGDGSGNWEYPSPQQMYNAMLRKGYTDTPQDAVESMVAVHNFLNEGAWAEIVEWERRFGGGLADGWHACARGEDSSQTGESWNDPRRGAPRLIRFMGRPDEPTPKARMLQMLGWAWPSKFASEPPFDRHDWFVQRTDANGETREVRYVIDYYSGPPEPTGEPVFFLDVRPAVDGPTAACERMLRWGGDVWWRASGGAARDGRQ